MTPTFSSARGTTPLWRTPEHERASVSGAEDLDGAVLVQVCGLDHRTNARSIVDKLRNELRSTRSLPVPDRPKHVQHGVAVRIRVVVAVEVREQPLTSNDVGDSIAVDVRRGGGVHLRERDAAGVL